MSEDTTNKEYSHVKAKREPAVAGRFYPASKGALEDLLYELLSEYRKTSSNEKIRAIIVPHAGYIFSGYVAAAAYGKVAKTKPKHIFIIGTSHYGRFPGASVNSGAKYVTPLGTIETDEPIVNDLLKNNFFKYLPEAHEFEHTIEVQIPFIQYIFNHKPTIIPIVIGTQDEHEIEAIAKGLKPYFTDENLFVISTDFSHYPTADNAVQVDRFMADTLCKNNKPLFSKVRKGIAARHIPHLETTACGWTSLLTLLSITQDEPFKYELVKYAHSGMHEEYGDNNHVVGYSAFTIKKQDKSEIITLSDDQKQLLLNIAYNSVCRATNSPQKYNLSKEDIPEILKKYYGAFVSVYVDNELRGCIGSFSLDKPLYKIIDQLAFDASINDYRYIPVSAIDLNFVRFEISVLTPLKAVSNINEIIPGIDGIYIRKGSKSGTYLPQVAKKTGWSVNELLSNCAEKKAGIGKNGWKDAEIFVYQAVVFSNR